MRLDIKEGEAVTLPCRRCASISIHLVIRKGTMSTRCAKCGGAIRFHIADGPAGGLELQPLGGREVPDQRARANA